MGRHGGSHAKERAAKPAKAFAKAPAGAPARKQPKPPAKKTVWQLIRTGLSMGLFGIVLALMIVAVIIPKVTGATPLTVLTSSMEPGLPPGTLLIVEPVDTNTIQIGDVVTYQIESGQPAVVTHRVTAVASSTTGERTFTFKGDNNDAEDPPVIAEQIQGRLWYSIPVVGYASTIINGPYRAVIIPVVAGAMLLYAAVSITIGLVAASKKRRANTRRADASLAAVISDAPGARDTPGARDSSGAPDSAVASEPA
ncbi:signal peptidase [Glaciihabitans tibetensis]|uniref:Signal peptidase I n=1 Tax=Glaciihabitans tibetensis TaxID=1266600 RepID=A0A2T0V3D0_9MICO|nr:signal peptidase I [Glaciihabitans tibetensis]PRY64670.1 signal peptidase [Glaciihabitans tibetensis]